MFIGVHKRLTDLCVVPYRQAIKAKKFWKKKSESSCFTRNKLRDIYAVCALGRKKFVEIDNF